jgi:hypothetical protein
MSQLGGVTGVSRRFRGQSDAKLRPGDKLRQQVGVNSPNVGMHPSREGSSRRILSSPAGPSPPPPRHHNWGPLIVPPHSFFALGDNRDASYDSRYYGFVPFANVIGRPSVIYFSFDPTSPEPFLARVRWNRIGQRVE